MTCFPMTFFKKSFGDPLAADVAFCAGAAALVSVSAIFVYCGKDDSIEYEIVITVTFVDPCMHSRH